MLGYMPRSRRRVRGKPGRPKPRRPTNRRAALDAIARAVARQDGIFDEVRQEAISSLPEQCRVDRITNPMDSVAPLEASRMALEAVGRQYAQVMGSYHWLFWLRRLPPTVFSASLPTSAPYRQALAEVMSSWTDSSEYFGAEVQKSVIPAVSQDQLEAVMRLCAVAHALAIIHSVIRRVGKGESVEWFRRNLPSTVPDPELDELISLYDRRCLSREGIHAGTQPFRFHPFFSEVPPGSKLEHFALVVNELPEVTDIPFWRGPVSAVRATSVKPGRFIAGGMTTSNIREIFRLSQGVSPWRDARLPSLMLLLRSLFLKTFISGWGSEWNPLPSVGYLVFPTADLANGIQPHITAASADLLEIMPEIVPADGSEVLANVAAIQASAWPLGRGPIMRTAGAQTVIDIHAASYRLDEMLTVVSSGGGSLVNARARHFENYVQRTIDQTGWAPKPPLRELWQKTLRINGEAITDLDALAACGSVALLVSCKSVPYSAAYERGDYGVVRNVRTNIEQSDVGWQKVINRLLLQPKGDNYDLEGYELYGVVCTPFVIFTHRQQNRTILSRGDHLLRATCSVSELIDFLGAHFAE